LSEQNFAVNEQADCKLESGSLVGNGKIWNCPVNPGLAAYNVELPIEGVSFAASQELTQTVPWVPNKLIVVVDGSVSVAPYYEEVLNALRTLPNGLLTKVVLVSDTNQLVGDFTEPDKPAFLNGLDTMKSASCVGGQDDTKQLSAAVSFAVQNPDTSVVWIHGAQPLGAADRSTLHTWLNKDLQHPILYDMQIASGPNELLNGISFAPGLQKVQRFGSVQSDLQDLFSRWANRTATLQFKRSCTRSPNTASLEDAQAHDREIAVLAANQRILAESNEDISKVSDDSYLLAEGLHIVTPISSAIASRRTRIRVHQHQQGSLLASVKQNVRAIRRVPAHMFDPVVGQLNNLSSAGGAASPGPAQSWTMPALPPLDLRYGQSNEVGQLKEYGSDSVVSGFRKSSAAPRVMHDLMEESTKDEEEPTQADSASRLVGALLNGSHTVSAIGPIMKSSEDKLVQKNSQSSDESGEQKPVPEPDSLWMILLSVCFIAFMIFQKWRVRFHHCR